jgi:hypothetical protein
MKLEEGKGFERGGEGQEGVASRVAVFSFYGRELGRGDRWASRDGNRLGTVSQYCAELVTKT